jgi:hypothetical protein
MPSYTIELTDVEQKSMEYISTDVDFWIQNAVHERARLAIEELVGDYIKIKMAAGEAISGTKDDIVMTSGLPDARTRNEENMKKMVPPTGL